MITAIVDRVPLSLNKRERMHWSERRKRNRAWYNTLLLTIGVAPTEERQNRKKREVYITQFRRRLIKDPDNLNASVKPILDALKERGQRKVAGKIMWVERLGWIKDDSFEYIDLYVKQVTARKERTVIVIKEREC